MDAATIRIVVQADGAGVAPGLKVATAAFVGFGDAATRALDKVKGAFAGLSTGQKALTGIGVAAVGFGVGLKAAIRPAIEFESAFTGVLKTVDGTPAQLNAIRDGLIGMSSVMPTTAVELAGIAENAGQLGVAAPRVLEFTKVIAQLGETTDLDFNSAAQSLARFMNVTGNDASVRRLGDVIAELGNNSATTESQILTFGTRLASALTIAGAREDEILALGAAFSSLGIEAEAGSTAVTRVVRDISDAAKLGGPELETFAETAGLLPEKFAEIARTNPVEALLLFGDGLGRVIEQGGSVTPILESLGLAGIRTGRALELLALGTDDIRASLALAANQFENGGALAEEYGLRAETTASRLDVLRNRLTSVAIAAGTPALDAFALGADAAGDAVLRLAELFTPVITQIGQLGASAASALAPLVAAIGSPALTIGIGALEGVAGALSAVVATVSLLDSRLVVFGALALGLRAMGTSAFFAATGLSSLSAASVATAGSMAVLKASLAFVPLAAATAALIVFRDEIQTVGQAAREAGDSYREGLNAAIEESDFSATATELEAIQDRVAEIKAISGVELREGFDGWADALKNVADAANFLDGSEENFSGLRAELDELEGILAETNADEYTAGIQRLANELGLSAEATDLAVRAAGEYDKAVQIGTMSLSEYMATNQGISSALQAQVDGLSRVTDEFAGFADQVIAGEATLATYQDQLDVTGEGLLALTSRIEGVEFGDLFDEEKAAGAADAVILLRNAYEELGAEIGLTGGEIANQLGLTDALAGSFSRLRTAVEASESSMAALGAQQQITNEATLAWEDALANVSDAATFEVAAAAMATLTRETAALTGSLDTAKAAQAGMAAELIAAGSAAGLSTTQISELVRTIGLVPDSHLITIIAEAQEAIAAGEEVNKVMADLEREIFLSITGDAAGALAVFDEAAAAAIALSGGVYAMTLTADDQASGTVDGLNAKIQSFFVGQEYSVTLTADDRATAATETLTEAILRLVGVYEVILEAQDNATPKVDNVLSRAQEWAGLVAVGTLDANDAASPKVDNVLNRALEWAGFVAVGTLDANDAASEKVGNVLNRAQEWAGFVATGTLDALDNATGTITLTRNEALSFAQGNYEAALRAADAGAAGEIASKVALAQGYASGDYTGQLRASDAGAASEIASKVGLARGYADGDYNAGLLATDRGAKLQIKAVQSAARGFADADYTAVLKANPGPAIAGIRAAISALAGFQSKRITLTTVRRTVTQSVATRSLSFFSGDNGGIVGTPSGGINRYDRGGIDLASGVPESSGRATIYSPAATFRIHSEPETGGEAYIPLAAAKRDRSISIWQETGRILGVLANGGIQMGRFASGGIAGQLSAASAANLPPVFAPSIQIRVDGTRAMDERQVAALARREAELALDAAARKFANRRG